MFEETGDEEKSQGWTALVLDANGNGKSDNYVEQRCAVLCRGKSGGQQYLGHIAGLSRLRGAPQPGPKSTGKRFGGSL
jgi:hypothetical protein